MAEQTGSYFPQNETVPGGKYIQGDNYIDANGKVIGKVEKETREKADRKADEVKK